ncbi:MAG: hypothetical protein ACOX06_03035 [Candidatus Dojkabacteria bacterium]|jgi:hypothetical protein
MTEERLNNNDNDFEYTPIFPAQDPAEKQRKYEEETQRIEKYFDEAMVEIPLGDNKIIWLEKNTDPEYCIMIGNSDEESKHLFLLLKPHTKPKSETDKQFEEMRRELLLQSMEMEDLHNIYNVFDGTVKKVKNLVDGKGGDPNKVSVSEMIVPVYLGEEKFNFYHMPDGIGSGHYDALRDAKRRVGYRNIKNNQ